VLAALIVQSDEKKYGVESHSPMRLSVIVMTDRSTILKRISSVKYRRRPIFFFKRNDSDITHVLMQGNSILG
jgi:hypothetical protein